MLNKHNFQQPQVNKGMFTDVATLLLRTNIFLAAMSSSSSDNVTQSVRPCPFFGMCLTSLVDQVF